MKTTIANVNTLNNTKILSLNVEGFDNVISMTVLTQRDDLSRFESDKYFEDDGIISGISYISNQYSYGERGFVAAEMCALMDLIDAQTDLCEENDELMEVYFIMLDAGNDKALLITNAVETLTYLDIELPEPRDEVKSIWCGSMCDDLDVDNNIMEALWVHPKTKGFKVPDSDFFDYKEGETPSYTGFEEYTGSFFSSTKTLKKDPEWFEFFEAVNRLVLRNHQLDFGYNLEDVKDEIGFLMNQYKSCKDIPDMVQLVFKSEESHKFYNVEINHHSVIIEYGGVGKSSTVDEKDFESYEEAKKFMDKKVISKIKSGYVKQ